MERLACLKMHCWENARERPTVGGRIHSTCVCQGLVSYYMRNSLLNKNNCGLNAWRALYEGGGPTSGVIGRMQVSRVMPWEGPAAPSVGRLVWGRLVPGRACPATPPWIHVSPRAGPCVCGWGAVFRRVPADPVRRVPACGDAHPSQACVYFDFPFRGRAAWVTEAVSQPTTLPTGA